MQLIIQELLAILQKSLALNPRIIGVLKSYTSPSPSDIQSLNTIGIKTCVILMQLK